MISRECLLVSGGPIQRKDEYTAGATGGGRGALGLAPWVAWRLKTPIRRPSSSPKERRKGIPWRGMTPCPAAARRWSQCLSTGSTEQRGRCIRLCVQARLGTSIPAGCPWMPPPFLHKPHPSGSQAQFFNDRQFTEFKSSVGRRCRRQNFSLRRWEADPPTWGRAVGAGNTPPSPRP